MVLGSSTAIQHQRCRLQIVNNKNNMECLINFVIANKNKSIFCFLIFISIVAIILNIYLPDNVCGRYSNKTLDFNGKNIIVQIADNDCKRVLGLSGKKPLSEEEGMFFVFENTGSHGFWMKDMSFSIDILWLDENFKVVGMETSLAPKTFPKVYGTNFISKYVLELATGMVDKNNIKVGNIIFLREL